MIVWLHFIIVGLLGKHVRHALRVLSLVASAFHTSFHAVRESCGVVGGEGLDAMYQESTVISENFSVTMESQSAKCGQYLSI